MDEKLADTAVDDNESCPKPQGSTSFLVGPNFMPGKVDPTICSTCQKCADALPKYILDHDSQDARTQNILPFHKNI